MIGLALSIWAAVMRSPMIRPADPGGAVLREDAFYSLREDGTKVLRE